jgi:signal transduction histidine kinase
VTDRGPGIKSSDLPHIWERYFKVDHKHKRPMLGTGLGLSIVRKVIDLHGGGCGVESEEGKGSTFWFELELS